ncbi:hypothetical protein HKX48_003531 [Thoreauomyces humboldtii]|nr:hypothetical protein HKX48_003531 [Thoreauomyces humboldtii]
MIEPVFEPVVVPVDPPEALPSELVDAALAQRRQEEEEAVDVLRGSAEHGGFRAHIWTRTEEVHGAAVGSVLHLALLDVQLVIGALFFRSGRAPEFAPGAVLPTQEEFERYRQSPADVIRQ